MRYTLLHPNSGLWGKREYRFMNRFFSKLNLSDIKIKPDGNSFPPDADDEMEESQDIVAQAEAPVEAAPVEG